MDIAVRPGDFLAEIQVDGKQAWIFETNRLRDAVGASFLVAELGRRAASRVETYGGRLVIGASGLARAIFPRREDATGWIEEQTRMAAHEMPGMEVLGAVAQLKGDGPLDVQDATGRAIGALPSVRTRLGGPAMQDRGLPWLLPCSYSGLPAEDRVNPVQPEHHRGRRVSASVGRRRDVFQDTRERVLQSLKDGGCQAALIKRIDDAVLHQAYYKLDPADEGGAEPLSGRDTWRGVVHVDANGLGWIFKEFGAISRARGAGRGEDVVRWLSAFSEAVERAAWRAVGEAIDAVATRAKASTTPIAVYPLVVGGDDITLVTDGRWALCLARVLIDRWTAACQGEPAIQETLKAARQLRSELPDTHLPACGGVAIVKHHFPFSIASKLAEELCGEAKRAFRSSGASGIDWHAVLDASPPELDELRRRLEVHEGERVTRLTRRPYALADFDALAGAAALLREKDEDGRPVLPRAQLHALREGLVLGRAEAERRRAQIARRHPRLNALLKELHGAPDLVRDDGTGVLDAFDHLELLEGLPGGAA